MEEGVEGVEQRGVKQGTEEAIPPSLPPKKIQSYHGESYPRGYGHYREPYLDSPGHRLESQTEKSTKRIKNEGPSVLPDSAQGPSEGSNPIPHSLGLGLGPLPYLCS